MAATTRAAAGGRQGAEERRRSEHGAGDDQLAAANQFQQADVTRNARDGSPSVDRTQHGNPNRQGQS